MSDDAEKSTAERAGGCVAVLTFPALVVWYGFVIAKTWNWHVAPALGLPALSTRLATALLLIWLLIRSRSTSSEVASWDWLGFHVFIPALTLLFAWLLTLLK